MYDFLSYNSELGLLDFQQYLHLKDPHFQEKKWRVIEFSVSYLFFNVSFSSERERYLRERDLREGEREIPEGERES